MKPVIGTFGIGTQRCIYALFEKARNKEENAFSAKVRPFDVMLIQVGDKTDKINASIEKIKENLEDSGLNVVVDDRVLGLQKKLALSEFLSIPSRILVGQQETNTDTYTLKSLTKQTGHFKLNELIQQTKQLVKE